MLTTEADCFIQKNHNVFADDYCLWVYTVIIYENQKALQTYRLYNSYMCA